MPSHKQLIALALLALTLIALPSRAQSVVTSYADDFQSYGTQKNPAGWVDTAIGSSTPTAGGLYKTWPDPTQAKGGTNVVYGTKQSSGKPEGKNPRIGTFSTYVDKSFGSAGRFEYKGRFLRTNSDSRVGLTFLSSYPQTDRYYLLGLWSNPSGALTMQLFGFGGGTPSGTTVSDFTPLPGKWYAFLIRIDDVDGKTAIHARFWLDTNPEPATWNIDAIDSSATRLTSGRIGIWSAVKGEVYVDNLSATSPVDHAAPTIQFFADDKPLTDGLKFNHVITPKIVVTDDLSGTNWTAMLDGLTYTENTPVTGQGEHVLAVTAVDAVGNRTSKSVTFFIDTIPPVVTIVKPANGSMTAGDVSVVLDVVDASLPYTTAATLDGQSFDVRNAITTEGQHTLVVTATDAVGLSSLPATTRFTIDRSAPTYELLANGAPLTPDRVFDRDVVLTINTHDLTPVTLTLLLDDGAYDAGTPIPDERRHTVRGTITDSVGHATTIAPVSFWIDKTAPVVTLLGNDEPLKDLYDVASLVLKIQADDITTTHISATLNNAAFTSPSTLTSEIEYELKGTVTDDAGHATPFGPRKFAIDRSAPVIVLKANGQPFPPSGHIFTGDVQVTLDVQDLTLSDTTATLDGAVISAFPLQLTDEFYHHVIKVVAADKLNHTASVGPLELTIDKLAPIVTITNPLGTELENDTFFDAPVTPVIDVVDISHTTVDAKLNGQHFESGTLVSADGAYTLTGTVTDEANRQTAIGPLTFTIDTVAPTGVFMEGENNPFPDGKSLNVDAIRAWVQITDANPLPATILLDGQPYSEKTPITSEDAHTLTATLRDKAGNTGVVAPVTFRIDRTAPRLTLFAFGDLFPSRPVESHVDVPVTFDAQDPSRPIAVTGILDGNEIALPFTITAEGEHTLSGKAVDAAGNTGTAGPYTIRLEKTPPQVEVLLNGEAAGIENVFNVAVSVTLRVSSGITSRTMAILLNGAAYAEGTAVDGEGEYLVSGTVTTGSGLVVNIPETAFTIDKTAPAVTLKNRDAAFEANGFHYNSDVVPNVTCTDNLTRCTVELTVDGAAWTSGDPITSEAAHVVVAGAVDRAGNRATLPPVDFVIDKTPPALTITSPTDGQVLSAANVIVRGASDDAVTITVNGAQATIDHDAKTYASPSINLAEGENELTVEGLDQAGNPAAPQRVKVVVDTRAPGLGNIQPPPNACLAANDVTVTGSVIDPGITTVRVALDDRVVENALDAQKGSFTAPFTAVAEGQHRITIEATDSLGHRTVNALQIVVDRGAPGIDVLEGGTPLARSLFNRPVALTFRARDIDPNVQLAVTMNGNPYVSGTALLAQGAYHFDAVAHDCAGNQFVLPVDVAIDLTAPLFDTITPAPNAVVGSAPNAITGHVSNDAVEVALNGTNVAVAPDAQGNFALPATIRDGNNGFVLRATDAAGNVTRLPYAFTLRAGAPTIQIMESGAPLADNALFNRPVRPTVEVSDPGARLLVLINGQTDNGEPLTADGTYTIVATAEDDLQRTAEARRTFTIDRTPPVITIQSPQPGDATTSTVDLAGTAGDAVTLNVHGLEVTPNADGTFRRNAVPLDLGINALVVSGTDRAGNTGHDSVTVNWRGDGPAILITQPADDSLTNRPRIDVAGRVLAPLPGGTVIVGSKSVTLDATAAFRATDYQLADGLNEIVVRLPNGPQAVVHVTADFNPPTLNVLVSGQPLADDAQFPSAITITVNATDDRQLELTRFTVDGTEAASPFSVSATGGHVLSAIARDKAGNETRIERTFFIGATSASGGCTIEDVDPSNNATVAPASNATITTVRVTGRAPGATSVSVGSVNADLADGTFAATIELPLEGANAFDARCRDASSTLSEPLHMTYFRVSGNPSVRITSPAENDVTAAATTTVRGEVGADVVEADVNGKRATITEGNPRTFSVDNVTLVPGVNVLVAHARNGAYRYGAHSVRIRSEQTQPVIRITQPQSNAVAGGLRTTVSGTYTNVRPSTLAIAGGANAPAVETVALSDTTGIFVFRDVNVAVGPNPLTVSGRNDANRSASATVLVNGDASVPAIAITQPLDNAWIAAENPIDVHGTYANATGTPRVEINGEAATVNESASTYSGTAQHSATSPLTPISARLRAADGTGPAATVTVRKLAGPLRIVNTFPENDAAGVDPAAVVLINFSAPLDRDSVSNIHLTKGGANVGGTLRVEDTVVVFTPSTLLESGTAYRVDVPLTVKDVAGHSLAEAASIAFTTLATAPSVPPAIDPITISGCPSTVEIHGTAPAFARLLLETGFTVPFDGTAGADGRFTIRFPLSGRSGYQSGRLYVIAADGSRSPAAPVTFRIDCAGPQVVGASFDRDGNVITIAFSKDVDPATIAVGPSSSIVLQVSDGTTPSGTASVSGANVTIVPADDLRAQSFTLEIKTTVTDTAGNALAVPFTQTFSAGGDEQPIPGDGSGFVSGEVYDAGTGRPLANVTVASAVPASAFARVPSVSSNSASTRYTIVGTPARPGKVATTATEIEVSRTTDERGRYVFALPEGAHTIEASSRDYTTVWRQIVVPAGAGVIPIDVRVQRRGAATPAASLPLTLTNGGGARSVTRPIKLTVTAGVAPDAKVAATSVGAQSLAGLLPLGWSPLASAEVAVFGADGNLVSAAPLTADLEFTLPSADIAAAQQTLAFVQYDSERDEWRTLVPAMTATSGDTWRVAIQNAGAYAVVYRDLASGLNQPPAAAAGVTLQPAAKSCDPCTLTRKDFDIEPPMVAPSETAVATLDIDGENANTFPSGTAVQAYVSEVLHLSDGGTVVDPPFTADVLLYRGMNGKSGIAEFVIAPSQTARNRVLESGVDQVRILHYPGRLDRGSLIGSEGGRVPGDDTLSLEIPSGATTEQLHATVATIPASELNVTVDGFDVVTGFTFALSRAQEPEPTDIDNDGVPDAPPAIELSRAARATVAIDTARLASPDAQLVLVELVNDGEWGSFHRLATPMVRLDTPQNGVTTVRLTTRTIDSELPIDGVVRAGRYLVLAAKAPIAIATGVIASQQNGPAVVGARITSAMPSGGAYGVFDVTRPSGIFAVPIAATPASSFTLTPRQPRLGVGRDYTAPAPARDAIVHVSDWTFEVQPLHLVSYTPHDGEQVPAAAIEIKAEFDLAIDASSLGDAVRVTNTDGNIPLGGAAVVDPANGKRIIWTSTGQVVAGATYSVTLQGNIRATNGARFGPPVAFTITTAPLPRDGTVKPDLIHISMPAADGTARIFGTAGAIPPTWRVNVLRPGRGFRSSYGADANPDGSFSLLIGGNDPYDRITIEDLIDLQVLNSAFNVAVTLRMPAFVTEDGKGFVARPESDSTFSSVQGLKLVVAAGTFAKPTLITTDVSTSAAAFAGVPNFATELKFHRAITINFEGTATKKIEVSLPINGLPTTGNDYILGYADESSRGPRVSIASLLVEDGDQFTTQLPAQASGSGARRVSTSSNMSFPSISAVMSCMPGVMQTGTYGLMQLTPPGGGLIGWATVNEMRALDIFNSVFTSLFMPGYAHFSRACRTVPVIAGQPFTLVGVDPTSGSEIFSTTYPGIEDPNTVVALPNPNPDRFGPYPIYATPFRVEQVDVPSLADTNGDNIPDTGLLITRGMKIELSSTGVLTVSNAPYAPSAYVLPEKTRVEFYDVTKSMHSNSATVGANGAFSMFLSGAAAGDQIYVYLSVPDVGPETIISVVFSEPISVGTIPPGADAPTQARLINQYLQGVMKFEQVAASGTVDLTSSVTFEALSEKRRVRVDMPAELARGGIYRLTLKSTITDSDGNKLAERKDASNNVEGEDAQDISMEFAVRPAPNVQNEFELLPNDTFTGAGLRDMAKYGNLVFVAATNGGLLAYDLAEPSSLKSTSGGQPKPIAVVPGAWKTGNTWADGVSPMWEFWSVAVDQHGRVYGGGFGGGSDGQFSLIRSYRVEDFLDARDNGSTEGCASGIGNNLNCRRYGTAIVGWRPGSTSGSLMGVSFATNQPTAYVRKLKLLEQDDNLTNPAGAPAAPRTFGDLAGGAVSGVQVLSGAPVAPGSEFNRATLRVGYAGSGGSSSYLIERITVINATLDMRWHADVYTGETADIKNVIARDSDTMIVLRNRTTYGVVTLFGYGAAVYDLNAVESNGVAPHCADSAFRGMHGAACATAILTTKLPEKVVVTNLDENTSCDGGTLWEGPDLMRYSPEVFGIVRTDVNTSTGTVNAVSPDMTLLALTGPSDSVLDMKVTLPSDADPNTASCATPGDIVAPSSGSPWMDQIYASTAGGWHRVTSGAMYHWEVAKEDNPTGLRGSAPKTAISRDYLLVAANDAGLVIYEVGGTRPSSSPGYWPLTGQHVVDTIWIAAGAQAVSVVEGTDLAAVIDRKGRLLLVDLSNIDERWAPAPATPAGTPASFNGDPFKLPTNAMLTPTTVPNEKGVNDPRVIYMSEQPFAFGVMPPLISADTGIALGGEILGKKMRVRPVLDPKVDFLIDAGLGKGLQSTGKIIPLGLPYPSSVATAAEGSLAAFRVRVTLPGAIGNALPGNQLHMAIESELVAGGVASQTPRSLPRSHLRLNDRTGNVDKRKVDFVLERVVPDIPTQEKEFRHQRGYNKFISPWVVAIADPRASERVLDAVRDDGCTLCKRPVALIGKTEADGVYEMYTNGRFVSARIDGNTPNVLPAASLPDFYDYLAEKSRFQSRVATVIADTVRPKSSLVAAQAPPVAQGTLDGTIYVHSGELQVGAGDLTLLGRGAANLQLTRSYRSHIIGGSPLGLGWEASFLRRVRELPNGDVEYRDGAGDIWLFKLPTSGPGAGAAPQLTDLEASIGTRFRYDPPDGLFNTLMRTEEGWTLLDPQWRVTRFDNLGRLIAESDEFWKPDDFGASAQGGNLFRYFYDSEGRLAQIVDPLYRVTTVSYYPEGVPNTDCTDLGSKTSPCAYPGLIKEIADWRGRSLLFEYDRVGRLIGVQSPKVDAVSGAPSDYDFSTDTKRPRVTYKYAGGNAYPNENAADQEFTDFMQYAANLESITDAAQETGGQVRVVYDWFKNNDPTRDHLKSVQWACASYVSSCSPKTADLTYAGDTAKITDLMDQKWEYTLTDGPDQRKHIATMTAVDVPTYNAAAGDVPTLTLPGEPASLTTTYSDFDASGIPLKTQLPSGRTIDLTVQAPPSNPKAPCKQITSVKESGSGAARDTLIGYGATATGLCTVANLQRNGETREHESPNRERKKTVVTDTKTHVETETQFDDFGRPTAVFETDTAGGSAGTTTLMFYKPNTGDQIAWQRLATVADAANTVTTSYDYYKEGAGQKVVETDSKRDITITTRYNAVDQPIYREVKDGRFGVLSEELTAYDADGRVAWTRRTGPSGVNFDTTTKYDAMGRAISTKSTGNNVDGNANTTLEVTQTYDLVTKQFVTNDPATSGGASGGKQTTTVDTMGRPTRVERSGGSDSLVQVYAYDAHGEVSYQGDTARTALAIVRDALGHEIQNTARDGVKQVMTWNAWDQPSETTVLAGGTTISHKKQLFSDEGVAFATNEEVDSRIRQTLMTWKNGGTEALTRVGATTGLDEDKLSNGAPIRATLTMTNASGLLTAITTGGALATDDTVTDVFHTTEYTDYRGDEPQTIVEHEPKRGASVTTTQQLDAFDRVRTSQISGEYEAVNTYDVAGNLHQVTPAGLGTTTTYHDARGLAYRVEKPGSANAVERKFDALGALREFKDETGDVTTYVTDGLGRVTEIKYADAPQTSEELKYENVSGLLLAQRDRAGNWLSYSYDDGGRITKVHDGEDPMSAPAIEVIEYDDAKHVKRIANADAGIEYENYDLLGRPQTTRRLRYANGTGTQDDPGNRVVTDVHTQTHTYSLFDGERTSWRMPTAGASMGTNGGAWRNDIGESRDAGTNLIEQRADSIAIANAVAAGDARISKQSRATAAGAWIETTYGFADMPGSGLTSIDPAVGVSGTLIESLTKRGNTTLSGTHTYPDKSLRVRGAVDLALGRASRWIYDARGRLTNGKLLVPREDIDTVPGTDDTLTDADFRSDRALTTSLTALDHSKLGDALSLTIEPLPWHADEQYGHQIDKRTVMLDSTPFERDYSFDGGRRTTDGVWTSAYDKFGRLMSIESTSLQRRIEYVYGPDDRVVGRKAIDLGTGGAELRSNVLAADGLPAETTFVWDPISDHLVAIYKAGESVAGGSSAPAGEAGLVRQYVHGGSGFDDIVDVLAASTPGGLPTRYIPIFDEAGTASLQAVVDGDGNLVERVLYGDSYGDAPRYLHGAVAEKVAFSAKRNQAGDVEEVHVSVRVSENVKEATIASGYRLAAIDDDGRILATYGQTPQFVDADDHHEVRWTVDALAWQNLISNPGTSGIEVAITSSLRTDVWGDDPIQEVPEWAKAIYSVTSDDDTKTPMIVRASFTTLATAPANGDEIKLYSIDNLYLAATPSSRAHLFTGFKASPFVEPATGLAYFRARWYDPATGTWLTPDPIGYQDSSDLYAFCGGDPVNCSDPLGLESLGQLVHGWSEDAFDSGNWLAIGGAALGETVYAAFEFASAGAVGKIDAAQEALDRGDITQGEYWKRTSVAVAQTAASYAVGGIAGKAGAQLTRGLVSRMLQGAVAGAIGGVSGTFASDVVGVAAGTQERFTSWQGYAGAGAFGAAFGGLEGYKIATRPGYHAEVSEYGESLARRFLRRSGFTDVEGIQNRSGHGIDVAAMDPSTNEAVFAEVKSSRGDNAPALNKAQQNARTFVTSRLNRAVSRVGAFRSVDPAVRARAGTYLASVRANGGNVRGYVIEVLNVGTTKQKIVIRTW